MRLDPVPDSVLISDPVPVPDPVLISDPVPDLVPVPGPCPDLGLDPGRGAYDSSGFNSDG